jgi:exonuclease V
MDAFVDLKRKSHIVISDVKTRVNSSLPRARDSRGSEMQLSLYHRILSNMIDGVVDMNRLYSELSLDPESVLSDGFLAEAGTSYSAAGILPFEMLLENNTLNVRFLLTILMIETMASRHERIVCFTWLSKRETGNCNPNMIYFSLQEYRHQMTTQIIGFKSFDYDHDTVTTYIHQVLEWWDGRRQSKGVEIEEAYRCRTCEYEEGCSWRAAKAAELAQRRPSQRSPPIYYSSDTR